MKKLLIGAFAHPDDEAFGPSGTLYLAAHNNSEVHLFCATRGEAGNNPDNHALLGHVRLKEWHEAAKLIGARSTKNLGLPDGALSNGHYLEIAEALIEYIDTCAAPHGEAVIDLMTMEPHGVTGHLDHVAMSRIATYVYLRLRRDNTKPYHVGRLLYFCLDESQQPDVSLDWLHMPKGYRHDAIALINDVHEALEAKIAIMKAHRSQRDDMNSILARGQELLTRECFLVYED